jgi:hypothetical protein
VAVGTEDGDDGGEVRDGRGSCVKAGVGVAKRPVRAKAVP